MSVLENYNNLKILVIGGSGQIGSSLKEISKNFKSPFYFPSSSDCNLQEGQSIKNFLNSHEVNFIINLAAYTNVDKAETNQKEANLVNHIGPMLIAKESHKREIPLIHFSTDYVFGGQGNGPFTPSSKKYPINEYGKSKSLGEDAVLLENNFSLVIRVASVFGYFGDNFVKTMTKLILTQENIKVISDNKISMSFASDFSENFLRILNLFYKEQLINKNGQNILHFVSPGFTNWFDVAQIIKDEILNFDINLPVAKILAINSNEWLSDAKRPIDSRLEIDNDSLGKYDIQLSSWETAVRKVVNRCLPSIINEVTNEK